MSRERLYATFYIGDSHFGVDALGVQEVLRHQPMTRVPLATDEVRGLINLRGQVVIALDLRRRLGLEPRPEERGSMNLVVCTDDGPVSLLVDRIGDVLPVDEDELEATPETVQGLSRELLLGVIKLESGLLHVLDVDRATAPAVVGAGAAT
jgi:purine-binding chemotaxis protein CheW